VKTYWTTRPTPVSGMTAPIVALEDPGEITLQWNAPLDSGGLSIVGYAIQARYQFPNGSWSLAEAAYDARGSLSRTGLITNILPNTEYAFSVQAYNFRTLCRPDEYVTPSDELRIKTQDASVPSQPKNFRWTHVTGGSITLAWDPPRSSGGEALLWYLVSGGFDYTQLNLMANVSAAAPTFVTLYGLSAWTYYEFAVAGENSRGPGSYTVPLAVTTTATSAPGPPKNLQQVPVASGGTIQLSWETPDDSGGAYVQQYTVHRDEKVVGVVPGTAFEDQVNLTANTAYSYSVVASNDALSGEIATKVFISGAASVSAPPSAITQAGSGFIELTIVPSPDSGGSPIVHFEFEVLLEEGTVFAGSTSEFTFTVAGLYAEKQYTIIIRTLNTQGKSAETVVTATTEAATIPDNTMSLRLVKVTGGLLRFEVTPPANFGGSEILRYIFYVNETIADVVQLSNTEYDIVGLSAESYYSVAVSATNSIGESSQSSLFVVSTTVASAPGAIPSLSLISKTTSTITVGWAMPPDTGGDEISLFKIRISSSDSSDEVPSYATLTILAGLKPATLHLIQVRGTNSKGGGPWSSTLSVTTERVSPGVITFKESEVYISEGGSMATLTLLRTNGGDILAKCKYQTTNGTAFPSVQYTETGGDITFERGSNLQEIKVPIINNEVTDDPDKYFFVSIQPYDNESGSIGDISTIKVSIVDDGDAGVLAFEHDTYSISENQTELTVTILRKNRFSGTGTVAIEIVSGVGDAVEGVDYTFNDTVVDIKDQQQQATVRITILSDDIFQALKLFQLRLRVLSGKIDVEASTATSSIQIVDDGDISPPSLPTSVSVVKKSGGAIEISWGPPEYLGAKAVSTLSYIVQVVDVQNSSERNVTVKATISLITQLVARQGYQFLVAADNSHRLGKFTTPQSILMDAPTPPSSPLNVQVLSQTGGMATLSWMLPVDMGGALLGEYRVNVSTSADNAFVGSYFTKVSITSTNGLLPLRTYSATVEAITKEGLAGEISLPVSFTTTDASVPGKPSALTITKATGGALFVEMSPPLDIGGTPIVSFSLFMTSSQYPNAFRQVYHGEHSSFVAARLVFSTTYKLQYKVANKVVRSVHLCLCIPGFFILWLLLTREQAS
jgi:hypothetical protein